MPEVCVTGSFTSPPKCFWHNIPFLYLKRSYQNHYHSEYSFVNELLDVSHILHVCTFEFQYLLQQEIKGLVFKNNVHTHDNHHFKDIVTKIKTQTVLTSMKFTSVYKLDKQWHENTSSLTAIKASPYLTRIFYSWAWKDVLYVTVCVHQVVIFTLWEALFIRFDKLQVHFFNTEDCFRW